MKVDILISGFGGQGVMSLGKIMAKVALLENKHAVWFPSYGAEMRGGTAHCFVKISDRKIAFPFIDSPDIAVIFNQPSLDKFKKKLKAQSLLIVNADLLNIPNRLKNIQVANIALNTLAIDCGDVKVANTVALGVLIALRPKLFKQQTIIDIMKERFGNSNIFQANLRALQRGQEVAE